MTPDPGGRPPRLLEALARLVIRGEGGPFVRADMSDTHASDLASGMSRSRAAWRYALNLIGSAFSMVSASVGKATLRGTLLDAKLGLRMLTKQPVLTGVAMLALGLGIPSSLVVHHGMSVMLRPFPVPDGDRVMGIRNRDMELRRDLPATVHEYELWRSSLTSFSAFAAVRPRMVNLRTDNAGDPPVSGAEATATFFDILGGRPILGRTLASSDQVPGSPDVAVISDAIWSARFARDPEILGQTVRIGARDHTVIGVMPGEFRYPWDEDVWLPLQARAVDYPMGEGPGLLVFGRLAEGIEEADADLEVELVTRRLAGDHPEIYERRMGQVVPMPILVLGEGEGIRNDPEILLIKSILMALLLIVCGNVGTLVLARTATRTGEISIRTALGATRTRVVTQIFIEALVLSLVATSIGLALGEGVARWLRQAATQSGDIPFWMDMGLSGEIVLIAFGLSALCTIVTGVIPALKATRTGVHSNLQRAASGSTMRFGWGSTTLIVSEVVLAVGFLAMGGTLVRSAFQDTAGLLGLDPERFLFAEVGLPGAESESSDVEGPAEGGEGLAELQAEVLRLLAREPHVGRAAMGQQVPGRSTPERRVVFEAAGEGERLRARVANVDVDFFRQMHHPILEGRDFTSADLETGPSGHRSAVIVNTGFVDQILGGRNPVGQRFRYPTATFEDETDAEWYEIVGVVGALGMNPFNPRRDGGIYHPLAPGEANPIRYLVEAEGDPSTLAPRFREMVARLDPEATVSRAVPLASMIETESRILRYLFLSQVVLAGVAFLLSVTGLYALMSFTVAQRTREIGVRTALGARPWAIVKTIARRAAVQLALGLSLGGVWGWVLLREIIDDSLTAPTSIPWTIGITIAGAGLVGMAACVSPTMRGLRIQPIEAMGDG